MLSTGEIERFHADGYLAGVEVLPAREARAARTALDGLRLRRGPTNDPMVHRHLDDPTTFALCARPSLVEAIAALLGPDVVLWHSRYFEKPAGAPEIYWHQDAPFWPISPCKTVSAWIALDPADLENGCLHVVPASHRRQLDHVRSTDSGRFAIKADPDQLDTTGARPVELQPGQAMLFDCRTLHRSGTNPSGRSRIGLSARYTTPDVVVDHHRLRPPVPDYGVIALRGNAREDLNPVTRAPT